MLACLCVISAYVMIGLLQVCAVCSKMGCLVDVCSWVVCMPCTGWVVACILLVPVTCVWCTVQKGKTVLHSAALGGHKEAVELLLGAGADPKAADKVHAGRPGCVLGLL